MDTHPDLRSAQEGDTLLVAANPRYRGPTDTVTAASSKALTQRALGERTVRERRGGPRGLTLLLLDNGREYDAATGLQHNSEETLIVQPCDEAEKVSS